MLHVMPINSSVALSILMLCARRVHSVLSAVVGACGYPSREERPTTGRAGESQKEEKKKKKEMTSQSLCIPWRRASPTGRCIRCGGQVGVWVVEERRRRGQVARYSHPNITGRQADHQHSIVASSSTSAHWYGHGRHAGGRHDEEEELARRGVPA